MGMPLAQIYPLVNADERSNPAHGGGFCIKRRALLTYTVWELTVDLRLIAPEYPDIYAQISSHPGHLGFRGCAECLLVVDWASDPISYPRPALSALEGPWPDHQPGLHPDEGGRSLRQSDDRPKPALADRLHLPQGHRLGLVLPVHRAR